ncbi:MAG TPA: acyl-CoA dehydrogenase family protein, partial [Actinophytocola sp.]|nr:acyl-CoA dehydrogenase family protein [Actinophytocola sp.]
MPLTQRSSWLDGEHKADLDSFRELAHSFCQKEITPNHERWSEAKQVDRELWRKAGEVGLLCLSIPEEHGGGGGTFAHEAVLLEEQARAGDDAWGNAVHSGIVAHYVNAFGTDDQKKRWLPRLASGDLVGAIAMTEPGTGSDLQNVKSRAIRD